MAEIYQYSVAILIGVAIFGAILGVLRLRHNRQMRSAEGLIRRLEGTAVPSLEGDDSPEKALQDDEILPARPSLYGIPYLAWIITSLVIPSVFLILFFENLTDPYSPPPVQTEAWIAYRAPAAFEFRGKQFPRHELLIPKGKLVTDSDRSVVQEALRNRESVGPENVLGTLLILTIFTLILLYHTNFLYPSSTEKNKNLILIYLTILIVLVCAKVALFYEVFSPYLIPVPWAGLMITVLINRRIVPLIMLITLIFVSLASQFDFGLFLVLLSGGLVSGSWVRQARRRSELMAASVMVGLVMAFVFLCELVLTGGGLFDAFPNAVAALTNGIIAALLTLIFLPIFERLFDFTSPFRLMELLDLNTPVLKELFFKAPGTYQHSMAVANIAESVANEIGANGLLVRVGAYYHDIGKMFSPEYFIENQVGGENLHEKLGLVASAAVLRSHVTMGVQLARQIKLPGAVEDFIPQHHGTSTIDYFYYKSKELESEIKSERVFKYPGPKPQSRETAIVMIVDSCEAACRVLESRDDEAVRQLVSRIVNRKLEQGELDQSGLTIGELKKIEDTVTHILKSTGHRRIAYPSDSESARKEEPRESSLRVVRRRGTAEKESSG